MKVEVSAQNYQNELIFYPYNYCGSIGQVGYPVMSFEATKKYTEWLGTENRVFMRPYIKKIPKPLKYCDELFDKDVLEIKQLVKDIGDLNTLIHREQKNLFCMMIVTLSVIHVLLNLIKISNLMEESHYNTIIIMKKL